MSVFLPFEQNLVEAPQNGAKWLAIGLQALPDNEWKQKITIVQPWRHDFLALKDGGFTCTPVLSENGQTFDGGLLQLSKHKGLNQNRFIELLLTIKSGGVLVVSGEKNLGIQSMQKWVQSIVPIEGKLSKNHGVVFWLCVPENLNRKRITSLKVATQAIENNFKTDAGMFSHGRVDNGSAMLVKHLEELVVGKTADFGAGWGYLSFQILQLCKKLKGLDLFEADYLALRAAEKHLAAVKNPTPINYYWQDITCEPVNEIYDTIVSNPPFHDGRAADVSLGQKFIEIAAKRLKSGGKLLLVANRQLPYENSIQKQFRNFSVIEEGNGFKVIVAIK